jgi:CheY-like chemotaxis protein
MKQAGITTEVIIISGHPMSDGKETIESLGASAWVDKPLSLEKLAQAIESTLGLTD